VPYKPFSGGKACAAVFLIIRSLEHDLTDKMGLRNYSFKKDVKD
jgi:hypothetical protein